MSIYDLAARLVISVAFCQAVVPKMRDAGRFERALANYQLMARPLVPLVARLVIVAECAAFVSLAFGIELAAGALVASVLLGAFAVAIVINLLRGRQFDCGCAGSSSKSISWPLALRDLALSAGAIALFVQPTTVAALHAGWRAASTTMAASTVAIVVLLTVLLGMTALLLLRAGQCIRLAGRVMRMQPAASGRLQLGQYNGKGDH